MSGTRVQPSSPAASARMRANRSRDTAPELAVRRLLHARGLRFRVHYAPLPGLRRRADIAFTRARLAIFIDGCFWHGCPEHGTQAKANAGFWHEKIETNRRRDVETTQRLEDADWLVLRFWEHEDFADVAGRIAEVVEDRPRR